MSTLASKTIPDSHRTFKDEKVGKTPRGRLKQIQTPTSPCIIPVLEGKMSTVDERTLATNENGTGVVPILQTVDNIMEKGQTFITAGNDFIPMDILNSLTEIPTPPTREQLGPPSKHKKLRPLESGGAPARRRPANVWNYPKGREKLKHLVEQPPCLCGAGKDISFLYDAVSSQEKEKSGLIDGKSKSLDKLPVSIEKQIRALGIIDTQEVNRKSIMGRKMEDSQMEVASQIPDTLLPAEYHIVKNPGVMGLEFHDEKYTTYVKNHEDHLTIFPSMFVLLLDPGYRENSAEKSLRKPAGRQEVLKLKHTMGSLLLRAGADDDGKELTGPTQIHNLLELVRKEQNIYNVCFNEIIRQVTIECAERGELLADLRKRYSDLLDRIPRQVKSLQQEVIAQRALDRRLTEELVRFKVSISTLTSELASVKAHDREVTQQAIEAQRELEEALHESEKNASLLAEYHELYELQRNRLQSQVGMLTEERDLWGSAAYILALKVTDRHSLNTAKKLHLCEKAWAKLARHFAIFLSEKDSIQLESLTGHVQLWREQADKFYKEVEESEDEMRKKLQRLVVQWQKWQKEFQKVVNFDDGSVTVPTHQFIANLYEDLKSWEEIFNQEAECFTGEVLLAREDELYQMNKQVDKWTDVALKVFSRHQTPEGDRFSQHEVMLALNQQVDMLHQQYHVRIIGENGVAKGIIDLVNPIETWGNKLNAILHGGEMMMDPEWIRLSDLVCNEWIDHLKETLLLIGSTQKEGARLAGEAENIIGVNNVVGKIVKWLSATTNGIDNEDGKIVEKVSLTHSAMIRWMITVLLRLAPDMEDKQLEQLSKDVDKADMDSSIGGGQILLESTSEEICNRAHRLFEEMRMFSSQLTKCCSDLVIDLMQERRDQGDEHADMEFKDLKRLTSECEGWVRTTQLLIQEAMGEDYVYDDRPLPEDSEKAKKEDDDKSGTTEPAVAISVEEDDMKSDDSRTTKSDGQKTAEQTPRGTPMGTQEPSETLTAPTPTRKSQETPEASDQLQTETKEAEGEDQGGEDGGDGTAPEGGKDDSSTVHVLGHDDNIRTKSLEQLPADQETGFLDVAESEAFPARSPSPDTKKALEALAAVERLQSQLLETEERAQGSEERAIQAETELKQALERVRALERAASRASASVSALSPGTQTPGSERPISSSASKRAHTQTPTTQSRSPSQQSTRASTRTSTRKK